MSDNNSGTIDLGNGIASLAWLSTAASQYSATVFLIRHIIAGKAHANIVQVKSVAPGGTGAVGTVAVQPMVNLADGLGNQISHGTIYSLPYFRLQGGASAVIMDPSVGDIGVAVFCDRDISAVKATGQVSPAGSRRQNDWQDGLYLGGFLNGAPSQYVEFAAGGMSVVTPGTLTLQASNVTLDGSGNFAVNGNVTGYAGSAAAVGLGSHKHVVGSPDTSAPIAGT